MSDHESEGEEVIEEPLDDRKPKRKIVRTKTPCSDKEVIARRGRSDVTNQREPRRGGRRKPAPGEKKDEGDKKEEEAK